MAAGPAAALPAAAPATGAAAALPGAAPANGRAPAAPWPRPGGAGARPACTLTSRVLNKALALSL